MTDLGTLDGADASRQSFAGGINAAGEIAGFDETAAGSFQATYWLPASGGGYGAPAALPALGGNSEARAINAAGQIVGWAESPSSDRHPVLWNQLPGGGYGAPIDLGGTVPGGAGEARAINVGGQIVGFRRFPAASGRTDVAAIWSPTSGGGYSGPTDLPLGGYGNNHAYGINDLGEIAGVSDGSPLVWMPGAGGVYGAPTNPGCNGGDARGINNAGQIVGSCDNDAAVWSPAPGGYTLARVPHATYGSFGAAISPAGEVVGETSASYAAVAAVWIPAAGGGYDQPATFGCCGAATGINAAGQVVGNQLTGFVQRGRIDHGFFVALKMTSTAIVSSANPSVVGQPVVYTATVTTFASSPPTVGTVTFTDGQATIAGCDSQPVDGSGHATCPVTYPTPGRHTIQAAYSGNGNFASSDSPVLRQAVYRAPTTAAVVSSANPSRVGQEVIFTATISVPAPGSGVPTGTVVFHDASGPLAGCGSQLTNSPVQDSCGGPVPGCGVRSVNASGQATCAVTYVLPGQRFVTAAYSGDSNFLPSTSPVLKQTVKPPL